MTDLPNLDHDRELLSLSGFFFEVIVKKYLEIERSYEKNETKIRSLFKKTRFTKYVKEWGDLYDTVSEASRRLLEHLDVTVCIKLPIIANESYNLMKSLIAYQIKVADLLVQKANGVQISMSVYLEAVGDCKAARDKMQIQMQLYDSTYRLYLMMSDMFPGMVNDQ